MSDLSLRTVVFLRKDDKVLLGYKKNGFGKGLYLGVGGKVENDETIEEAAVREIEEEIKVIALDLVKVAELKFLFATKPSWN